MKKVIASLNSCNFNKLYKFREVQEKGVELIITDHGKPVIKIIPYSENPEEALNRLRNTVIKYDHPTEPVGLEEWEALR